MKHRIISAISAAVMTANIIGALPAEAYAAGSAESRTYEKEGYNVTYRIEGEWQDHHRIEITLQNTGDEPILNWALKYESSGELSDLWNSRLYERNEEFVIIKNSGYNYEIEPAGSVTCGYIVTGENCIIPENIELCSRRIDVSSGYDVDLDIINDWHTGFQAEVEIENTSDEPIEAWTLFFNGNFTINNLWDAKLLANENGSYEIANQLWTTPIKPGEKTSFGFTADKSATVETKAENYRLTAVVIGESSLEYEPVTDFEQDSDSDGLPDYYEKILGTDPKNADTDGDGLSDGYEVMYLGTDPLKADSDDNGINDGDEDSDNDGLSNLKECELGTDPKNADTDGDGLSDGEEVNKYRTDPLKYDTDGDKISDGDEIKLGLDPKSTLSNGILDNERIFEQTLPSDSDAFSAINSDEETPFDVSIDIKAAGAAESNIAVRESGYSNIIENSAIIGTAPEFIYTDGLKVDEVTVKFELEESVVNNTLGIYADESDEFKGIKRLNVFRYFEDINMLLPIETFHDEASKTVYAKTDRMGTYCLVDMEIFLDNLSEQLNSEDQLENEVRVEESEAMSQNTADEYICRSVDKYEAKTRSEDDFDVVFLIDSRKLVSKNGSTDFEVIKRNITEAADTIFIKSPNAHVRIVVMNPMLGSGWDKSTYRVMKVSDIRGVEPSKNNSFFTNYEDVCSAIEEIRNENRSGEDCNLTDALRDTYEYAKAIRRKTIIFCLFKAKGTLYQSKNESAYDFLNDIRDNSLDISINAICDDSDQSEKYGYAVDMCNMTKGLFSDGYEHSSEMMLSQIYVDGGKIQNAYRAIIATGYKTIELTSSLQQNYEWYQKSKTEDIENVDDTDGDGLYDYQEIMFENEITSLYGKVSYEELITVDENGDVILPTFKYITYNVLDLAYVEKGLERYCNITGENARGVIQSLNNVPILPIKSDPTIKDGDGDGFEDAVDKNPLGYKIENKSIIIYDISSEDIDSEINYRKNFAPIYKKISNTEYIPCSFYDSEGISYCDNFVDIWNEINIPKALELKGAVFYEIESLTIVAHGAIGEMAGFTSNNVFENQINSIIFPISKLKQQKINKLTLEICNSGNLDATDAGRNLNIALAFLKSQPNIKEVYAYDGYVSYNIALNISITKPILNPSQKNSDDFMNKSIEINGRGRFSNGKVKYYRDSNGNICCNNKYKYCFISDTMNLYDYFSRNFITIFGVTNQYDLLIKLDAIKYNPLRIEVIVDVN